MSDLRADHIQQPGQQWVLLSFAGPKMRQKHRDFAVKVRGVFATQEDAARVAKQFQDSGDRFDIFTAQMYHWLPCPPDLTKIQDQKYTDDRLNAIMSGHEMAQQDAKEQFDRRKEALQRDGLDQHLLPGERQEEADDETVRYLNARR